MRKMLTSVFAEKYGITMEASLTGSNPNMPGFPGTHWTCDLRRGEESLRVIYSRGEAREGPPEVGEILDTLASDAHTLENGEDFGTWARELGYSSNEDLHDAWNTYEAVKVQTEKLKDFLREEGLYAILLYHTEGD